MQDILVLSPQAHSRFALTDEAIDSLAYQMTAVFPADRLRFFIRGDMLFAEVTNATTKANISVCLVEDFFKEKPVSLSAAEVLDEYVYTFEQYEPDEDEDNIVHFSYSMENCLNEKFASAQ